jgi:hypothetical protein
LSPLFDWAGVKDMSRLWNMVSAVQGSSLKDRITIGFVLLLAVLFLLAQLLMIVYWIAYDVPPDAI